MLQLYYLSRSTGREEEIAVTPEMIEAGLDVVRSWEPDWTDLTPPGRLRGIMALRVYRAMQARDLAGSRVD